MIFQDNEKRTNNEDQHFTLTFKGIMCTQRLEFTWCKKIPEAENWSLVANFQVSFYISPHHTFTRRSPPMFSHQIEFLATKNPRMHSNFRIQSEVNMGELVNVTTNRWPPWDLEHRSKRREDQGCSLGDVTKMPTSWLSKWFWFRRLLLLDEFACLSSHRWPDHPTPKLLIWFRFFDTSSRSDKNQLFFSSCMELGITKMFTDYPALQKPPISRVSSEK